MVLLDKRFALVVLLVVFCIVFSVSVFAELKNTSAVANKQLVGNDADVHGCIGSAGYSWCEAKQKCLRVWEEKCIVIPLKSRVSAIANERLQGLKNDAIAGINQLKRTEFEKIQGLKKEELEKLKDLKAADFNNWSQLKKETLKELTALKQEQIDKIKGLKATELWKLSNLRQDRKEKLLDLNQAFINRVVSVVPKDSIANILDFNSEILATVSDLNDEELAIVSQLDAETAKTILSQPKPLLKARLRAAIALNSAKLDFLRVRERFEFAREKFLDAKQTFLEKRDAFQKLRDKIKSAPVADKNTLREELKDNAQQVLLHQVNAILNHLEAIQNKNIDLDDVNALIEKFTILQDKLEDENASKETLIEAAKEIRELWSQTKQIVEKKVLVALNNHLTSLIEKSNAAYEKANAKIAELKQAGKDTVKVESALAFYKNQIDAAKALNDEATALLSSGQNFDFVKIRQDIVKAGGKLRTSYILIARIVGACNRLAVGEAADINPGILSDDAEYEDLQ